MYRYQFSTYVTHFPDGGTEFAPYPIIATIEFRNDEQKINPLHCPKINATQYPVLLKSRNLCTVCSLNIVFFEDFKIYAGLWPRGFPSVSACVHNGRSNTSAVAELE